MRSTWSDLSPAVASQAVRLRGSGVAWVALGVPALAIALAALVLSAAEAPSDAGEADAWAEVMQAAFCVWSLMLLPLLTALLAAQVAALEHGARSWKHLFAMPVWKGAHVASMWLAVAGLTALATTALAVGIAVVGTVVSTLRPALEMPAAPVLALAQAAGLVYVCTLPLVGGHLWLSIRWPGVGVGLGVAIAGVLTNVVLLNLGAGVWTPYGLAPSALMQGQSWLAGIGLTVGVAVLVASMWHITRRDAPG
ncbi:MAG: ABC transporter permease [Bacteroidota bacterium]